MQNRTLTDIYMFLKIKLRRSFNSIINLGNVTKILQVQL